MSRYEYKDIKGTIYTAGWTGTEFYVRRSLNGYGNSTQEHVCNPIVGVADLYVNAREIGINLPPNVLIQLINDQLLPGEINPFEIDLQGWKCVESEINPTLDEAIPLDEIILVEEQEPDVWRLATTEYVFEYSDLKLLVARFPTGQMFIRVERHTEDKADLTFALQRDENTGAWGQVPAMPKGNDDSDMFSCPVCHVAYSTEHQAVLCSRQHSRGQA